MAFATASNLLKDAEAQGLLRDLIGGGPIDVKRTRAQHMPTKILAIDQGTTSTRAILFDERHDIVAIEQQEFAQYYPQSGWVEHDPEDLWNSTIAVVKGVFAKTGTTADHVAAIGIANQRETTLIWDRVTGRPIYNAIVWQDRRTAGV